jgi:hypothetical protein
MLYRTLGKTGLQVSILGFGTSRLGSVFHPKMKAPRPGTPPHPTKSGPRVNVPLHSAVIFRKRPARSVLCSVPIGRVLRLLSGYRKWPDVARGLISILSAAKRIQ